MVKLQGIQCIDEEDILCQGNYSPVHMGAVKVKFQVPEGCALVILLKIQICGHARYQLILCFLEQNKVHNFTKIIYNYFCQVPSKSRHINVPIPLDLLPSGTFTSRPFFTIWAHTRSENECLSLKSELCLIKVKSCI